MMRSFFALLLFIPTLAYAQYGAAPQRQGTLPVATLQTCGPVTGTLSAAGQSIVLPAACSSFGTNIITITTATGDTPFVGTITSTDALTGGPRRLHKTGVGPLQNASETLLGNQAALLEYRTCGGAGPQAVTASAYTSGRATVTIYAMQMTTACFVNGSVQTPEEAALRANKAFSVFTGNQSVTAGQYMSLIFTNPTGSGIRAIITYRGLQCDGPTTVVSSKWWGIRNPTVNVPTTTLTPSNRGNTAANATPSVMQVAYTASATTYPDTNPATALTSRPGGIVPSGGVSGGPLHRLRTVEAGQSTSLSLLAIATGLTTQNGGNPFCQIEMDWYEEAAQ